MKMRAKFIKSEAWKKLLPSWDEMYQLLPDSIKRIFLKLQQIKENPNWHPEDNALEHIKIVYDKALETGDPDLLMAALFHDLGKAFTARLKPEGYSSSHGHEAVSVRLVDTPENINFIEYFGANPETVKWLVANHMRMHIFNEMKPAKRKLLSQHQDFDKLLIFAEIDSAAKTE